MIKTLSPYSNTEKTAEIMSRYRPIAPKPEAAATTYPASESQSISPKIRQSAYLRNLWPQLQARPTRTRKRGRTAIMSPPTFKRPRTTQVLGFSSPCNLSFRGFTPGFPQLPISNFQLEDPVITDPSSLTLQFLPCPPSDRAPGVLELDFIKSFDEKKAIDLNGTSDEHIPEEKNLLQQLQGPAATINVIAPLPVRPVGSSILVGRISEDPTLTPPVQSTKKPEDVEKEVESEILPAIISDSYNRVRMANSAYKQMVGQPECPWLDSMVGSSSCNRISGDVILHFSDSRLPVSANGFSCWARIEWGGGANKSSMNAFCDVIRLSCESRDYLFTWRFHIQTKEASQSSCNV